MNLPNSSKAVVEPRKLEDYLLNPAHPDNGGKAAFFRSLGFRQGNGRELRAALLEMAAASGPAKCLDSPHGMKYILDGRIRGTDGNTAKARTIWIVDTGQSAPRLVTAYPATTERMSHD
ncbi:MAG: hypothetical protein H8E20_03990 [Verrucomicrobia bacterium]|nr:hypothetical protein [Verrucomicrobiota bacterium]